MEIGGEVLRPTRRRRPRYQSDNAYQTADSGGVYLLALFFILGAVFGTLVGAFSDAEGIPKMVRQYVIPESSGPAFIGVLWNTSWYHLLAIFLGGSVFGLILLPLLSALRGYLLAITVASIIVSIPENGVILALIYLGLPAVLSVPCFFLLLTDAFALSKKLYALIGGNHRQAGNAPFFRHVAVCSAALVAAALLETYVSPMFARIIL